MKVNKQELNIDFIGGEKPLTKKEEKKISAFIRSRKENFGPNSSPRATPAPTSSRQ